MSAKIMGEVWELNLPANEQIVLLAMADHADHNGGNVFPSNALIAWKAGMSEDTVIRMKKRLESRGILVLEQAAPGCVKRYRIDVSKGERKAKYVSTSSLTPPAISDHPQVATPRKLRLPLPQSPATPPPANCDPPQVARGRTALRPPHPQSSAAPPPAELCDPNRQRTVSEPPIARATHAPDDANIPTWEDVRVEAQVRAVPETSAKAFFDHHEDNALWLNQHNRLINWKTKLLSWAANDRQLKQTNASNHYRGSPHGPGRPQGPDRNAGTFNADQDVEAIKSKVR